MEKLSDTLFALTELDSNTWQSDVEHISGKKQPLTAARVQRLRADYTRTNEPTRSFAADPGSCQKPHY